MASQIEEPIVRDNEEYVRQKLGYRVRAKNGAYKKQTLDITDEMLLDIPCLIISIDASTQQDPYNIISYKSELSNVDGNIIKTTDLLMNSKRNATLNSIGIYDVPDIWGFPTNDTVGVFKLFNSETSISQPVNKLEKNISCLS